MLDKATTSTGLILLGLSSLANGSSSNTNDFHNHSSRKLYAVGFEYNTPKFKKTTIDIYVESNYRMYDNLANKYTLPDYGFMHVVQKLSQNQVDLDEEFNLALDALFASKINSKPTKKRF
jgi:hypothetical protein